MNNELALDEILFEFHKAVDMPTPAIIAKWVRAYPQFADEIRAHAVEIIDMEALAAAAEVTMAGDAVVRPQAAPEAAVPSQSRGGSTLREIIRAAGLSLPAFADEVAIARSIVSDVNSGRIVATTIPRKFICLAAERLKQTVDELAATIVGPKEATAPPMLKAVSGPVAGRPMTWEEAVQASDMDSERKAFWLSDEG